MPFRILSITVLLVCLAVSSFAAAPLTDFVGAAEQLHLAADVAPVSNLTFSVGHMTVKLTSGSAARVLAGNEPVGLFFKGNGSFQYEDVLTADGDNAKVEITETIRPLAPASVLEFSLLSEVLERRIRGLNLRGVTDD